MNALMVNSIIWYTLLQNNQDISQNLDALINENVDFYIRDLVFMVFFYQLFKLKKIEIILNPKITSEKEIFAKLRRYQKRVIMVFCMFFIFLAFNVFEILYYITTKKEY